MKSKLKTIKRSKTKMYEIEHYKTFKEIEIEKIKELLKDKTLKNWSRVVLNEYLYSLKHDR